ncbi:MAG TPA: aldo/keto reductase [Bryobacteraceae bacterium]|nr:aldo/keto reductase [Bryobacteraceae bacterium]
MARISRRSFIGAAALGSVAASSARAAEGLPKRLLGRTGARVSIVAFGAGSRFLQYDEAQGIAALNHALDLGINYIDTAYAYGNGESERRVGKVMKTRRQEVFLATKVADRDADKAMRTIEGSLERLGTDHVDLLHVHGLKDADDLAAVEAPKGVLRLLYKLRDDKVARAIGITSHSDPAVLARALERHDFDCTQMALNGALAGMASGGPRSLGEMSFQAVVLPVTRRKAIGVIAMKVFGQGQLVGPAAPEMLLRYALSLPVATAVAGMPKTELIEANVEIAKNFKPLSSTEMDDFSDRLSAGYKAGLDRFLRHHADA